MTLHGHLLHLFQLFALLVLSGAVLATWFDLLRAFWRAGNSEPEKEKRREVGQ